MTAAQKDPALAWWADGELAVAGRLDALTDDELAAPSALPDWSRAHVVAHLARNADALVNLLTWARTGVETPMYPSREVRNAGIETTAAQLPEELRADYAAACARLAVAIETMPASAWTAQVRSGQGKEIPATDVPWMRAKEVWVHGVDLRAGLTFADLPADLCTALVDEVLALFAGRDQALGRDDRGHRRRPHLGHRGGAGGGPRDGDRRLAHPVRRLRAPRRRPAGARLARLRRGTAGQVRGAARRRPGLSLPCACRKGKGVTAHPARCGVTATRTASRGRSTPRGSLRHRIPEDGTGEASPDGAPGSPPPSW